MASMSLPTTTQVLEAAEHLPEGAALIVPQVSWDEYERLLEALAPRHLRVSYDCGRLQIVSPLPEHERYGRFIEDLVLLYCQAFDITLEKLGSTTWKKRALAKGAEPDCCYYVGNAKRIIGKRNLDLESDPPPDIVVEIDTTNSSLGKFLIYAALCVPEIWRYDGQTVTIYRLRRKEYVKVSQSPSLPEMTGELLAESLELSKTQGQTSARLAFQKRIRSLK
jgi:Uma2 family endonuclease